MFCETIKISLKTTLMSDSVWCVTYGCAHKKKNKTLTVIFLPIFLWEMSKKMTKCPVSYYTYVLTLVKYSCSKSKKRILSGNGLCPQTDADDHVWSECKLEQLISWAWTANHLHGAEARRAGTLLPKHLWAAHTGATSP